MGHIRNYRYPLNAESTVANENGKKTTSDIRLQFTLQALLLALLSFFSCVLCS